MKKLTTLLFISACSLVIFGAWVQSDNGKAGYTNSPGEGNCTSCHSDFAVNAGGGSVYATSNMPNWQYTPGQTYTINVVVKRTGMGLFAFGTELLSGVNNAGTFVITDGVRTQIKSKTVNGVSRSNVVHQFDGGLSADSSVFSFDWTAPATNIGNLMLYYSGLACNADGNEGGDYVYCDSTSISVVTGVNQISDNYSLSVFPNPVSEIINLNYYLNKSSNVTAQLISMDGKISQTLINEFQQAGNVSKSINLPNDLPKGNYIVQINSDNGKVLKKIVVN